MATDPRISVTIPVYDEESGIPQLIQRVTAVLDPLPGGPHEIVVVDDGSRDRSFELLHELATRDPRIVVVGLSRNFGQQAALGAAFDFVSGDVVVPMDADLQDSPELIPRFLEEYNKGFDVVYAVRTRRKEGPILRGCYHLYYRLMSFLSNVKVPEHAGDFCLMSRRVVEHLKNTPERHRYWRGLRAWVGFPQIGIPVERAERFTGQSKYTVRKLFKLASDGIFAFTVAPLRAATLAGAATLSITALLTAYSVLAWMLGSATGASLGVLATLFFAGVQLIFTGVLGEYLGRIYEEIKGRPHYIVRDVIGRTVTEAASVRRGDAAQPPLGTDARRRAIWRQVLVDAEAAREANSRAA